VVIWYIFPPFLVCCTKKNLATIDFAQAKVCLLKKTRTVSSVLLLLGKGLLIRARIRRGKVLAGNSFSFRRPKPDFNAWAQGKVSFVQFLKVYKQK
jgi:hypothetical protein